MTIDKKICLLVKCLTALKKTKLSELTNHEILDSGTGFFVMGRWIITAQHVIDVAPNETVYAVFEDALIPVVVKREAHGYEDDIYLDYATCFTKANFDDSFDISFCEPKNGERLIFLGFSRRFKEKSVSSHAFYDGEFYLNRIEGSCFQNTVLVTKYKKDFSNGFIMLFDQPILEFPYGMSGGPILSADYHLRGLTSLGYGVNSKVTGCQGLHLYRPLLWIAE
jgi:hypothetical protein